MIVALGAKVPLVTVATIPFASTMAMMPVESVERYWSGWGRAWVEPLRWREYLLA